MSTQLDHRVPRYLAKHHLWTYPWECFWMKLAFELVDGHHPTHWRAWRELKDRGKRNLDFLPDCLSQNVNLLPLVCLLLRFQIQIGPYTIYWFPSSQAFTYSDWIILANSLGVQLADDRVLRRLCFQNYMGQFHIISLSPPPIYIHTHIHKHAHTHTHNLLVLLFWRTLILYCINTIAPVE